MMNNVVVPVDFSETASTALKFGASLAQLMQLDLLVVHISDLVLSGEHTLTTPEQQKDEAEMKEQLAKFALKNTAPAFAANQGRTAFIPAVHHSLLTGMAVSQILYLSREVSTSFIVMGGVGAGAGAEAPSLYGSVATPVALKGGCPVFLIPKGYGAVSVDRLAIAFEDAEEIIRIGKFSKAVIKALRPEVRYVHVSKADLLSEFENENDFVDFAWSEDAPAHIYKSDFLPEGNVAEQLSHYAGERRIDLLILGGKRLGFWQRLFKKQHLKPIIQAVQVPMMIVPFSDEEEL